MEEIKKILMQLMEGQESLKTEVIGIKSDITGMKSDIKGMKSDINDLMEGQEAIRIDVSELKSDVNLLKSDVICMKADINALKDDVKKNSISLEAIENKINIIAEVQTAHKEQDDRAFKNSDALFGENFDLIETALKSTTNDLKEIKDDIDFLKHEEYQTKQDIFKINKYLTVVK